MKPIEQIQTIIGATVDNEWGPNSESAFRSFLRKNYEIPVIDPTPSGKSHPFVAIGSEWIGREETSRNHFTGMEKLWADTNYPNGYEDRAPYCAAFQCFIVAEAIRRGTKVQARPVTPSVGEFRNWARSHGFVANTPHQGDQFTLLPSGISHIGLVKHVDGDIIATIEGNTDAEGTREGDGFWLKSRRISKCDFIRIPIL